MEALFQDHNCAFHRESSKFLELPAGTGGPHPDFADRQTGRYELISWPSSKAWKELLP